MTGPTRLDDVPNPKLFTQCRNTWKSQTLTAAERTTWRGIPIDPELGECLRPGASTCGIPRPVVSVRPAHG